MTNQKHKMTISEDKIIEIYNNEYMNGVSTIKLGEKYNVNSSYFSRWFKNLGLATRSNKINSRKYYANDDYFESINTPEKAYWLGFIYADGYISSTNGKKFGMALSEKDSKHLSSLNKCLDSTYPVNTYATTSGYKIGSKYCRIIISSDKMYDDLVRHGVYEHKTRIIKPPNIEYSLIKHFILGYFDGDGSIFLNNTKYPFYSVNIVGTDCLLNFISNYFFENGLTNNEEARLEKRKKEHTVSYIRYGGNLIVNRILSHLYSGIDKDIPLKRKYNLYLKCKNKEFI